jgi:hypothetical protein
MSPFAIPIVHPAIVNLRKLGKLLHFLAGLLILSSALHQLQSPFVNHIYFWCQILIGADILIMVFTSNNLAQELPRVNLVFRLIESVIFLGASLVMMLEQNLIMGSVLLAICIGYCFVLYCEKNIIRVETVQFQHLGVTISGIPHNQFFAWTQINHVEARYDSIHIEAAGGKTYHFGLRKNLHFDELDQIHEFCSHYLGVKEP